MKGYVLAIEGERKVVLPSGEIFSAEQADSESKKLAAKLLASAVRIGPRETLVSLASGTLR